MSYKGARSARKAPIAVVLVVLLLVGSVLWFGGRTVHTTPTAEQYYQALKAYVET